MQAWATPRRGRAATKHATLPARERGRLRIRRGGRAVEGARLESVYTPKRRIEGSNPSLSATRSPAARFRTEQGHHRRLGREAAAEREMQIHALHAPLALHSEQIHPRGLVRELLLLDLAQVTGADAIARLGKL